MDVQLKKGLMEACVLAELCRGEAHGYGILKDTELSVHLSESALYHILKRLEGAGHVSARSVERDGRLRRVYAITESGRDRLRVFIEDWREAMRAFQFIREASGI